MRTVPPLIRGSLLSTCVIALVSCAFSPGHILADDFSRDVLPILADRCFHCHGPDENHREADLRLDLRESAVDSNAIVPRKPEISELIKRVSSADPDQQMPPPDSGRKPLSKTEIENLAKWINDGAKWGKHWAFESPKRRELPIQGVHPIDAFVRARLVKEGLPWSLPAEKHTLLRRVSFDLTGLPPTVAELRAFEADESKDAFSKVVNRLLKSPHYGERMAVWWLDAARYSDTDGYQGDATRTNWPWRDWVIDSFNRNQRFDRFTIEQFAGDLLPNRKPEQILATGFHRNHMTNGEGGRDPEESRIDYVIDRVNSMGTVWLGMTLGCCQCHSHKFDPITQTDYYQLFAYFNSIDEDGRAGGGAKPFLKYRSPFVPKSIEEARQTVKLRQPRFDAIKKKAEAEFEIWLEQKVKQVAGGYDGWRVLTPTHLSSVEGTVLKAHEGMIQATGPNPVQDDYHIVATPSTKRVTGIRLDVYPHQSHTKGRLSRGANGEFILTDVKLQLRRKGQSQLIDIDIAGAVASAEKKVGGRNYGVVAGTLDDDPRNGWTTESHDPTKAYHAIFALAEPLYLDQDQELVFVMLHRSTRGDGNIGRFRLSVTDQPGPAVRTTQLMPLEELAKAKVDDAKKVDSKLRGRLLAQFLADHRPYQHIKSQLDAARSQQSKVSRAAGEVKVMVLGERKDARQTHVLERGVWDKKGKRVLPGVPGAILPRDAKKVQSRLQLAEWIVSDENPLTARVVVNHLWQLCFGAGLVRTPEDFGLQGERPTHPDLLDWLAVELMAHDWDLQHILRLIVTSETYQQRSHISQYARERDPENRLLARGARFRLPSWMIRDAALRSSGLLNSTLGGPPTMPYQPPGVWAEMFMGRFRYAPSQGTTQHRRTVYAFWRRAAAPTFLFDSSQRRVCEVRPRRTNTPLHALTMLNDESQLEAARAVAVRVQKVKGDVATRLKQLYLLVLSRQPTISELQVLEREYTKAALHFEKHPGDAKKLLDFGQLEFRPTKGHAESAAYFVVASMVFNLDEAITHE